MVFLHFWTCKVLEEYSDKCVENDKCVEKRRTGLFLPVYLPHPNWSFEHSINHRLWPQAFSVEDSEVAINREPQRSRACGRCSPWCWTEAPARLRLAVSLYPSAPPHFRFRLLFVLFVGTPPCYGRPRITRITFLHQAFWQFCWPFSNLAGIQPVSIPVHWPLEEKNYHELWKMNYERDSRFG